MARADLMALSADDLASLTNRGTVKRAQRELEAARLTFALSETDGEVVFDWSDGTQCRFPADGTIHEATCSSSLQGISRHVVRSVLAYQQVGGAGSEPERRDEPAENGPREGSAEMGRSGASLADPPAPSSPSAAAPGAIEPWDPGAIDDSALIEVFGARSVTKARARWAEGGLVELMRGPKPTARFIDEPITVRFMVPHDLRYASSDSAERQRPVWVALAVFAFRALEPARLAGVVSHQQSASPPPEGLDEADDALDELLRDGWMNASSTWAARMRRTEARLRSDGATWPADLVAELAHQREMYAERDARFDPAQGVLQTGELVARSRALRHASLGVPHLMVRGSKHDRATEIRGSRLVGVGLGVRPGRDRVVLSAYVQDVHGGAVMAVERTVVDPDDGRPVPFARLADASVARGCSLASFARSQVVLKGGKRAPSGLLTLPRGASHIGVHAQAYEWEQLRPPFAVERFDQITERLDALPPAYLRSRRRNEDLHAIAVRGVEGADYDVAHQRLTGILHDAAGGTARLVFDYYARGHAGFEALAQALERAPEHVRFICGHVRRAGSTLEVRPVSVVLEDAGRRTCLLPWVGGGEWADDGSARAAPTVGPANLVDEFLDDLLSRAADLMTTGTRAGAREGWDRLAGRAAALGFTRLLEPIRAVEHALSVRATSLGTATEGPLRELCLWLRAAR